KDRRRLRPGASPQFAGDRNASVRVHALWPGGPSLLHPRASFANVMSCLALFVALGGASYAAVSLPNNSVGAKQIKRAAIDNSKVKKGSLLKSSFKSGQLPKGARGLKGVKGA